MRRAVLGVLLLAPVMTCAGEGPPPPHFPGVIGKGPHVEVMPRAGGNPFSCYLLGFKDGIFTFQMLAGEARTVRAEDVQGLRFILYPPPPPPQTPPQPPPQQQPRRRGVGEPGIKRLKDLIEKDHAQGLSATEVDELYRLRWDAPVFPGDMTTLRRIELARKMTLQESSKGRLDRFHKSLQERLRNAEDEEDARDCILVLMMIYLQKGHVPVQIKESVQRDVTAIQNEEVRKALLDRLPEIPEPPGFLRMRRP
ncbi:MAG TPA: hypothetical protein VEK08_26710 [Planctomycetota bacterium]|nr:hypothetical protein [Planctomycetota bacterium]